MASDLHKYYLPVMHQGQEMKSFICKVNTQHCQRGLTQPYKPRESCLAAPRALLRNSALFMGPQAEAQLGVYLCPTFLNLSFCNSLTLWVYHDWGPTKDHQELSGRQEGRIWGSAVKRPRLEFRCSPFQLWDLGQALSPSEPKLSPLPSGGQMSPDLEMLHTLLCASQMQSPRTVPF